MSEIERYDCEEDRSCEYEVKAVMQVNSTGYSVRHADHLVYLNEMRLDRDAQRLRADTAEAELALTEKEIEGLQSAPGDAEQRIERMSEVLQLLRVCASISPDLKRAIDAALNQKSEGESHE